MAAAARYCARHVPSSFVSNCFKTVSNVCVVSAPPSPAYRLLRLFPARFITRMFQKVMAPVREASWHVVVDCIAVAGRFQPVDQSLFGEQPCVVADLARVVPVNFHGSW